MIISNQVVAAPSLTYKQGTANYDNVHATVPLAYPGNVTAGNLLVVCMDAGSSATFSTPTDTLSNVWTAVASTPAVAGVNRAYMWWAIANSSGATTVSFPSSGAGNHIAVVSEYTVVGNARWIDGSGVNSSATATSLTVTTSAAIGATDTVIAFFLAGGGVLSTPTTGYTSRIADVLGGGPYARLSDKIAAAAGAQTAAVTCTSGAVAGVTANFTVAPALVQAVSRGYVAGSTLAFASNNTAGNPLFLLFCGSARSAPTDSAGNVWQPLTVYSGTYSSQIYWCPSCKGGSAPATQLVTDAFTRANENPLANSAWTTGPTASGMKLVSNMAQTSTTSAGWNTSYLNAIFGIPADHYSEITIISTGTGSQGGPMVRATASGCYFADVARIGSYTGNIYKLTSGGAATGLGSAALTVAANDVFRLTAVGNTFTLYQNGTQVIQGTDASYPTGAPGMAGYTSSVAPVYDNFAAGALTNTVTFGSADGFTIAEFSGVTTLDQGGSAGASGNSTAWTSNAITTVYPNELILGVVGATAGVTAVTAPYAILGTNETYSCAFYKIVSVIQTANSGAGTCTSGTWSVAIASVCTPTVNPNSINGR